MANFCRFCGKELVNGACDCKEFLNDGIIEDNSSYDKDYYKDPFIVPKIELDFTNISTLVTSIRNQTGISEEGSIELNPYERDMAIVPDCIEPEENEIVVKQYDIARLRTRLKFMKAEGRLQVTNRRILFRAAGTSLTGNILQEHQFNLDEIGGIEIHKDYKFSILSFLICLIVCNGYISGWMSTLFDITAVRATEIIGVLIGIMGIVPTFIVYKRHLLKYVCSFAGATALSMAVAASNKGTGFTILYVIAEVIMFINLVIVCFVPNLVINIKTKGASGALVIGSQKSMFRRKTGDDYSGFAEVMPWKDTVMAMNEIGTMIDDLQKHGDYAIEKWSR